MAASTVTRPVSHIARRIARTERADTAPAPVRYEVADLLARIEAALGRPVAMNDAA